MKQKKDICCIPGCNKKVWVKKHQLCTGHYTRYRINGAPGNTKIRKRTTLAIYIPPIQS